jgi:hypothetical protein
VSLNLLQSHHVCNPYAKACGLFGLVNVEPHQFKTPWEKNQDDNQTP